jgi:hypothetical protein
VTNADGKLRLSWAQIAWGISLLAAMLAAWYDLRSQQAVILYRVTRLETVAASEVYNKATVDAMRKESEVDRADLRRRIETLERRAGR